MGKKGGASAIDLFVGEFKNAIEFFVLIGWGLVGVVYAVVYLVGRVVGVMKPVPKRRLTFEDFNHTGAAKEESSNNYSAALGVPPKPKWREWRHWLIGWLVFIPVGFVLAGCLFVIFGIVGLCCGEYVSRDSTADLIGVGGYVAMALSVYPVWRVFLAPYEWWMSLLRDDDDDDDE
jgi:hypothetical protein